MRTLLLSVFLLFCTPSFAADVVGNGGDVVWCSSGRPFKIELLDFYEAKVFDPQFILDLGGSRLSLEEKIDYNLNKITHFSKLRTELYRTQLNDFMSQVLWTDQELTDIQDSNHLFLPPDCKIRQIAILMPEGKNPSFKYIINRKLWDRLSLEQKVGLMFHEVIYKEARAFEHEDSVAVRKFNSWIAGASFRNATQEQFDKFLLDAKLPLYLQNPVYPELYLSGFENNGREASALIAIKSNLVVGDQQMTLLPGTPIFFYGDTLSVSRLSLRRQEYRYDEGGRYEPVKFKSYTDECKLNLFGISIPIDDLYYDVDSYSNAGGWDFSIRFNRDGQVVGADKFRSLKPIFLDIPIFGGSKIKARLHTPVDNPTERRWQGGLWYTSSDEQFGGSEQYYIFQLVASGIYSVEINSLPVYGSGEVLLYPDKRLRLLYAEPGSQFYVAGFPQTIITIPPGDSQRRVHLNPEGHVVNFGWDGEQIRIIE